MVKMHAYQRNESLQHRICEWLTVKEDYVFVLFSMFCVVQRIHFKESEGINLGIFHFQKSLLLPSLLAASEFIILYVVHFLFLFLELNLENYNGKLNRKTTIEIKRKWNEFSPLKEWTKNTDKNATKTLEEN